MQVLSEAAGALADFAAGLAALIAVPTSCIGPRRELAKKAPFLPDRWTDLWHMWIGAAARP